MKIKIENKWALICEHTSIDINTNLLSTFNIIDELTINPPQKPLPQLPPEGFSIPARHEFASLWSRDAKSIHDALKIKAKLKLFTPGDSVPAEHDIEINFEKGKANLRLVMKFDGIKVKVPGEYRCEIVINDDQVQTVKATAGFIVKF